jgi:thiosulfate/3-mercaptopyruvate sulfurtransferase
MTNPLVSADELRRLLGSVTVLDVRYRLGAPGGVDEFAAGHVPGSSYVDLDRDLADPPGDRGRHPLPDPDRFGAAMRAAGVSAARPVVVYDDWGARAAARCWWLLRHHGHDDVRVLDGGWPAWVDARGPVETGTPDVAPGDFTGEPGHLPVLETRDVPSFTGLLVDARAPERFRGEVEPVDPVAGHIPGAANVPTEANLALDGRFRSVDELRSLYGVGDGREVATYCGSGVTACHDLLALAVIDVEGRLYPGSWSEWVADPSRPVDRGQVR